MSPSDSHICFVGDSVALLFSPLVQMIRNPLLIESVSFW